MPPLFFIFPHIYVLYICHTPYLFQGVNMFIFRFMRGLECKGIRGGWRPLPPNPQKTAKNEFKHLPTSNITLPQLSTPTHIKKPRGLLRVTHKTAINGFQNLWGVGTKKPRQW